MYSCVIDCVLTGCTSSYHSCSESDHTNITLLDRNIASDITYNTYVIQDVCPEVSFDSPLPYFRANSKDLFSS